jgi:hypothetical protein
VVTRITTSERRASAAAHHADMRESADHCDPLRVAGQWQHPFVLQQHDALARNFEHSGVVGSHVDFSHRFCCLLTVPEASISYHDSAACFRWCKSALLQRTERSAVRLRWRIR